MGDVDALFDEATNNQKKNQRTNELLRTFALCQDGYKLGNKFSAQRQWITRLYEGEMQSLHDKRIFLSNLAKVANFFRYAWYMEEVERPFYIRGLENHCEGELASFLVQYLKNANSKLSAPILARFYSQATADSAYVSDLIEASKACAAFFTLWRSARSTSGLDDIYRRFFKGNDKPVQVSKHSWTHHPSQLSAMDLKRYFVDVLKEKGLDQKDAWLYASEKFLVYTGLKTVCRFVLFLGGHDQVKDSNNPGLTTVGNKGVCPLLGLDQWRAKDYKTLEHVAPKKPPPQHKWDKNIYSGDAVDEIGNLLLLPTDINRYANNKDWSIKYLYYCHVGQRSKRQIKKLEAEAKRYGYNLKKRAVSALHAARYSCVVEPVLSLGLKGKWTATMIDRRTDQIKIIAWNTLSGWLGL